MENKLPAGWGNDEISRFLDVARRNCLATFGRVKKTYHLLTSVDSEYRAVIENLNQTKEVMLAAFLLRSHSCWLTAVGLALSCQVYETYPILRDCVEVSLYGWYIDRNREALNAWAHREDDEKSKERAKNLFTIGRIFKELRATYPSLHESVSHLYNRTIDFGAHPNVLGFSTNWAVKEGNGQVTFETRYQNTEALPVILALKTTAEVGIASLSLFRWVWRERYDLLGVTHRIDGLKRLLNTIAASATRLSGTETIDELDGLRIL